MESTKKLVDGSPAYKEATLNARLFELFSLIVTTLVIIVTFITNGLSSTTLASSFGFKNTTSTVSDIFYSQITPAGFTFIIWGFIYTWQVMWLLYGWSFVCRPRAVRSIFVGAYWMYALANVCNIAWIYLWGNEFIKASLGLLFPFDLCLYATVVLLWIYFYRQAESVRNYSKIDYWLTWFLPINGVMFYATWVTIATLANLASVLQYYTDLTPANSGTISLALLTVLVITYFILENTVLDRFTRYVFSVYLVVVWALIGIVKEHWGKEGQQRNAIFTLILLIVVILHVVARIILFVIFTLWRPKATYQQAKTVYA